MAYPDDATVFDVTIQWRDAAGVLTTEYFSTSSRAGSSTDVTSTGFIDGRVRQVAFSEWLFGPYRTRGAREIGSCGITLSNSDGGLDVWRDRSIHMCAVVVRKVNLADLTTGTVIFDGYAEQLEVNESQVTVFARDKTFIFNAPARQAVYGGTNVAPNGVDGDSSQKGQRKPWMLGDNQNDIPLTSVNTSKLIYQVDGVSGITNSFTTPLTVADAGVALTYNGADISSAALEAAVVPAGSFRVYKPDGLVKLGSQPVGTLTARLSNPYVTPMTGVTPAVDNVSIQYQGTEWHYYMALVARKLDASINVSASSDFVYVSAGQNQVDLVGLWVPDGATYLDVLNSIAAAGAGGAAWYYRGNTITALLLKDPSTATATVNYTDSDFKLGSGASSLRKVASGDEDRGIPVWKVTAKHRHNYVVLTGGDLAGSVNADQRMFHGMEDFQLYSSDSTVKTQWPNAPEIEVQTNHTGIPVARPQAIADRLLGLYKVRRDFFDGDLPLDKATTLPDIGAIVNIKHSRFGLSAGKNFAVIGRSWDVARGVCTLTFWG